MARRMSFFMEATLPAMRLAEKGRCCSAVASRVEVSADLVAAPAFKAGGTGDPRPAGSIPVHLRYLAPGARES
jgi:hypothetical protein